MPDTTGMTNDEIAALRDFLEAGLSPEPSTERCPRSPALSPGQGLLLPPGMNERELSSLQVYYTILCYYTIL